jgi:hypothetical protein
MGSPLNSNPLRKVKCSAILLTIYSLPRDEKREKRLRKEKSKLLRLEIWKRCPSLPRGP